MATLLRERARPALVRDYPPGSWFAAAQAARSAAAGGMANMTRGVGTKLGLAVTTLALHARALSLHAGELLAAGALATAAAVATQGRHSSPAGAGD